MSLAEWVTDVPFCNVHRARKALGCSRQLLGELIEERIIRVQEGYDCNRANDPTYTEVPRIKTDSIASFINRIITWWWDDRKLIRLRKLDKSLEKLSLSNSSLKIELREIKAILGIKMVDNGNGLRFELEEGIEADREMVRLLKYE